MGGLQLVTPYFLCILLSSRSGRPLSSFSLHKPLPPNTHTHTHQEPNRRPSPRTIPSLRRRQATFIKYFFSKYLTNAPCASRSFPMTYFLTVRLHSVGGHSSSLDENAHQSIFLQFYWQKITFKFQIIFKHYFMLSLINFTTFYCKNCSNI